MKPEIAVIGAGAVGMFYGAKLAQNRYHVEFQSRSSAGLLKRKRIKIKSIWGNFSLKLKVFESTSEMKYADIIILSTKNLPGIDYEALISPVLKKNSIIVCLQNGIGKEEQLSEYFSNTNHIVYSFMYSVTFTIKLSTKSRLEFSFF